MSGHSSAWRQIRLHVLMLLAAFSLACTEPPGGQLLTAATNNDPTAVEELLEAGKVDVNYQAPSNGESALATASGLGYAGVVELLLARGADPNVRTKDGQTPLLRAAYDGNAEVIAMLIAAKADLNVAETRYGYTPLAAAAKNGRLDAVRVLLEAGADVGSRTVAGKVPAQLASENGHGEVARILATRAR